MTKRLIVLLLLLLTAVPVLAQAAGGGVAHWSMVEGVPTAQNFVYTLSNTAVATSVSTPVVVPATCAAAVAGGGSTCSAPVTAAMFIRGTFTLCASDGFSVACSVPFTPGTVSNPGGFFVSRQ